MRSFLVLIFMSLVAVADGQTTINMVNYNFQPSKITVTPGTKVTWVNKSNMQHTSTSGTGCKGDGKWNSGLVDSGKSFTYTFTTEGTYPYFCTPHCGQGMNGVVEVKGSGKKTGTAVPEKKNDALTGAEPAAHSHMESADAAARQPQDTLKKKSVAESSSILVSMMNYNFEPASITVPPGTKVTWTNRSNNTHTTTSGTSCANDGKWNSGNLGEGESYSHTFDSEGDFPYFCIPHCSMGMVGVVHVVKGAATPTGTVDESALTYSRKKQPTPGFKSMDVINSPSTYILGKHVLDVSIYHRFDNISGTNGGDQVLYGLDNMRDIRLSLSYGLFKRVTIGIARSKGDWFNTPAQEIKDLYDGSIRVKLLQQDTSGIPVSLTVFGNTVRSGMYSQPGTGGEADFHHPSDRWSHAAQLMVSRDFGRHLTLQLMGTYVRRNWVNCCAGSKDNIDMGAAGAAGRWALTQKLALIGEYYYVISKYHDDHKDVFFNPLAVGLEINTGGHVFHINFSNSTGLIPNTYLPYTTSSWKDNGIRFGFSITRKFNMDNIKKRK